MKRHLLVAVLTALMLTLFGATTNLFDSPVVADDDGFSAKSIKGNWGFSAIGTILTPGGATPVAVVGVINFDGKNGCAFTNKVNLGGTANPPDGFRNSTSCTYSVNSDGTGSLVVNFDGDPGPTPLSFAIVGESDELQFIRTDIGVAQGVAKRQHGDDD